MSDKKEQHYIDEFPTERHLKTGRNIGFKNICPHAKLNMNHHLQQMKYDPTKRSHIVSHRSKPKMKPFGEIDKKHLFDI